MNTATAFHNLFSRFFIIVIFRHSRYNIIWGSRFKPEVQVCPLPEPDSRTSGSELGSDWIQKVWEPDHGQSSGAGDGGEMSRWSAVGR